MVKKTTPKKPPGRPPHEPTTASRNMAAVLAGAGISQKDIALALEISEPTLSLHYRRQLDSAPPLHAGRSYANLLRIASNGSGMASVRAALAILMRHAPGWIQTSKVQVQEKPPYKGYGGPGGWIAYMQRVLAEQPDDNDDAES